MQKASQYHQRAKECRELASRTAKPEHKSMLEGMAETWERLAVQRQGLVARRARIEAIEGAKHQAVSEQIENC